MHMHYIVAHYHFISKKITSRDLKLEYVPTLEQLVDIFTNLLR